MAQCGTYLLLKGIKCAMALERLMHSRAQIIMLASLTVVLGNCNCGRSAPPPPVTTKGTLYAIHVARISTPSNTAAEALSIDFGCVNVSSPAFDDVVRIG